MTMNEHELTSTFGLLKYVFLLVFLTLALSLLDHLHLLRRRGINPDTPRNLAKAVTVD